MRVNNIYDIPDIDKYMDEVFSFQCYSDGAHIYHYNEGLECIEVSIHSMDNYFENKLTLSDLIDKELVGYMSFTKYYQEERVSSYDLVDADVQDYAANIECIESLCGILNRSDVSSVKIVKLSGDVETYEHSDVNSYRS